MNKVVKRSGEVVSFNGAKIVTAIEKANAEVKGTLTKEGAENISNAVQEFFEEKEQVIVEEIQDAVEDALWANGFKEIAKAYIRYRQTHKDRRELRSEAQQNLVKTYKQILYGSAEESDLRRDNANINTDAPMGQMLKMGTESCKFFVDNYTLDPEVALADKENYIHIHELDRGFAA